MNNISMFVDMTGVQLEIGQRVVYGKSNRNAPIALGVITDIGDDYVYILGDGNIKAGAISGSHIALNSRIVVINA